MDIREKYAKLVEKINELYDKYYDACPDASDVETWPDEEMLLKARNLGMFMGIEQVYDFLHDKVDQEILKSEE